MKTSVETYNELIPFINTLVDTYRVDANHSKNMGYGFYININKELYVNIRIWGDEVYVSLARRGGCHFHDVANDTDLKFTRNIRDIKEVERVVREYLDYAKTLEPTYKVELTESELSTIINLVDENLKEKLKNYLQVK